MSARSGPRRWCVIPPADMCAYVIYGYGVKWVRHKCVIWRGPATKDMPSRHTQTPPTTGTHRLVNTHLNYLPGPSTPSAGARLLRGRSPPAGTLLPRTPSPPPRDTVVCLMDEWVWWLSVGQCKRTQTHTRTDLHIHVLLLHAWQRPHYNLDCDSTYLVKVGQLVLQPDLEVERPGLVPLFVGG